MITIIFYYLLIHHGLFIHAEPSESPNSFMKIETQEEGTTNLCKLIPQGLVRLPEDDTVHPNTTEWWFGFGNLQDNQGRSIDYVSIIYKFYTSGVPFLVGDTSIFINRQINYELSTHFTPFETIPNGYKFDLGHIKLEGGNGTDTVYVSAGKYSLDLQLTQVKAPLLYFNEGFMSPYLGGYFYYYSRPRSVATGVLTHGNETYQVSGISYTDHEYGILDPLAVNGWDWFVMHLDDGTDIIIYLIKPGLSEVWISYPNCEYERLDAQDIFIEVIGRWVSPMTGCSWPYGWQFNIKQKRYVVIPVGEDYEILHPRQIYWEGPVTISGDGNGRGIAELVGYCRI
jgi:predicted secreted hydrolase